MSEAQLFAATTFTEIYERVLVGPPAAEAATRSPTPRGTALFVLPLTSNTATAELLVRADGNLGASC